MMLTFWSAILFGFCSTAAFSATKRKQRRLMIPWIALAAGGAYFLISLWYFHQPEISLGVPIRLDIPILVPFLLYSLYVGIATKKKSEPKGPKEI